MKKLLIVLAVLVLLPGVASAGSYSVCPTDNVFHYVMTFYGTSGCTVGDKVFSGFGFFGMQSGGSPGLDDWNTIITPLAGPNDSGLRFEATVPWVGHDAGWGMTPFSYVVIYYTVTVLPGGNPITGACLEMSNAAFTPPSSILAQLTVGPGVVGLSDNGSACESLGPLQSVSVSNYMEIRGGDVSFGIPGGAHGVLESHIQETPVPEPASLLLLGTGLVGFAGRAWRKRRW